MYKTIASSRLRVCLVELCSPAHFPQCRDVTTLSAINRGIRASKELRETRRWETLRGKRKVPETNHLPKRRDERAVETANGKSIARGPRILKHTSLDRDVFDSSPSHIPRNIRRPRLVSAGNVIDAGQKRGTGRSRGTFLAGQRGDVRRDSQTESQDRAKHGVTVQSERISGHVSRSVAAFRDNMPIAVPHTTAASVFIYGLNSVIAALKARRRTLYKLYWQPKRLNDDGIHKDGCNMEQIRALAMAAGVSIHDATRDYAMMDRMSDGRPHNGVVLEASRLPVLPARSLGRPLARGDRISLILGPQNREDKAITGSPEYITSVPRYKRNPFVLLLDGVKDPVNIGSILRSAHFYGVDAVAVATNTCANLASAVMAKASSGACEVVQLLSLDRPSDFVRQSSQAGWRIYAAVAPQDKDSSRDNPKQRSRHLASSSLAHLNPLAKHPCILMLGSEGHGLPDHLINRARYLISISRGVNPRNVPDVGVDSMNVGVAAGVLMDGFLRPLENKVAGGE